MKRRLLFHPYALRDIDDHFEYLAVNGNIAVADRFLDMLADTQSSILETPELGSPWESKQVNGIRYRILRRFKNHVVFYRISEDSVEIVRVLHGSRNVERRLLEVDE